MKIKKNICFVSDTIDNRFTGLWPSIKVSHTELSTEMVDNHAQQWFYKALPICG